MLEGMDTPTPAPAPRPSNCHAESRRAEILRIQKLTIVERIKMALSLGSKFAGIQPVPRKDLGSGG